MLVNYSIVMILIIMCILRIELLLLDHHSKFRYFSIKKNVNSDACSYVWSVIKY